jgi:dTDP-4-amino-4,6-dideoxygalactose transaminase
VGEETLAVVPVHMHGIPCAMRAILAVSQQHGVSVVEDCAQAAGATLDGQKAGTFGDAAFFSLGRGKGFTAYEGGIGVGEPGSGAATEARGSGREELLTLVKLLAMAIFFQPRLYWPLRALPLGWGNEVYALDFAIGRMGRFRQGVALSVLKRLDEVVAGRRARAEYLLKRLHGATDLQFLVPPEGSQPSYPWLPLLAQQREEAVRRLQARGLGASRLFTCSLNQYEYLRDIVPPGSFPNAEHMAAHLLTLPTHEYVTQRDMDLMVAVLNEVACP